MKKLILALSILVLFSTGAMAKTYHLFFIDQKEVINVGGVDYNAWVLGTDPVRYFMEAGDPRPEGYTVHDVLLQASSGVNDMIYITTRNPTIAAETTLYPEYAGGSKTGVKDAWIDFTIKSMYQLGAHSAFAAGAAAKLVLLCEWKVADEWVYGTLAEWQTAGFPLDSASCHSGTTFLGVD